MLPFFDRIEKVIMNILIINHYAGSPRHGMEVRHFYLGREWVRSGHKVTMIAASFTHLRKMTGEAHDIRGLVAEEAIAGLRYIWLKSPKYQGNGIGRVINMMSFTGLLYQKGKMLVETVKPDLVIASSPHPFVIFGARKIAKLSSARLIFEVRDLWPLTLYELANLSPWHPLSLVMQWTENYAYRVADHVVCMLPKADSYMVEHGLAPGKFAYIPIGVDLRDRDHKTSCLPELHREILSAEKASGRFIVGYSGTYGVGDTLSVLLAAAALLHGKPVTTVLVGDGPGKNVLQNWIKKRRINNVILLPPIPRQAVPDFLAYMDACYIGYYDNPLYRYGIAPNKVMDYMMAAKPIIFAINAGNNPVAESGGGISVPPEDPGTVAGAILRLMAMDPWERKAMGARGRKYVIDHYAYRVLAEKFLEVIEAEPIH
jgi:glycosyltransferase involved in cell wall biosynthesis